ncbi:MAG: PAAR domain-containing protein [Gammaproteobacteria bacterium]|nr:PAAR domain-containing protein [Gammaproteobacteria bacterium]MDH5692825.1 PAAR domain-containing protein [Gammaproteobacteria bacterium]
MSYLDRLSLAVDQHAMGVTGDNTNGYIDNGERTLNTFSEMSGVYERWWDSASKATENPLLRNPDGSARSFDTLSGGEQVAVVLRTASNITGAVMGALSSVQDALNVGFANLTAPLAAVWPSFPASTMTSLYIGSPHGHPHPPSYIPAPPPGAVVPLPSLGNVLIGNHIKTLIGSLPAARAGDIGIAPTCLGFTPFFEIKTGSSNVFIGGKRAARMLDICMCCQPASGAASFVDKAMATAGVVAGAISIGANVAEAAVETDAAMQAAKAMAAAMDAAQMAADAAAMAVQAAMGKDPAVIPGPGPAGAGPMPVSGALTIGFPLVIVGGFPMVNIPDPVSLILNKIEKRVRRGRASNDENPEAGTNPCS